MVVKRKYIVLLLNLLLTHYLVSQMQNDANSFHFHPIASELKSSDESKAIGSFDFASMNLSSGVANVNIPIYNISDGPISVPINLFYSTKGVKVDQEASWVGLGWNLYAGASIVKETRGLPDENFKNKINTIANASTNQTIYAWMQAMLAKCADPYSNVPSSQILFFLWDAAKYFNPCSHPVQQLRDIQPDLYTLNINGSSIQFIFDYDFTCKILNNNYDYKIVTVDGKSFTVIDAAGNKYFFSNADTERVHFNNLSSSYYNPNAVTTYVNIDFLWNAPTYNQTECSAYAKLGSVGNPPRYKWNVTNIVSADNKYKIDFTYDDYGYTTYDFNFIYPIDKTALAPYYYPIPDSYTFIYNLDFGIRAQFTSNTYMAKRIKKIESTHAYIDFGANTVRSDMMTGNNYLNASPSQNSPPTALDFIKIYNKKNQILKAFVFNYSYFTTTAVDNYTHRNKRLRLNTLSELGSDLSQRKPNYTFEYDATSLPVKYSYEQDFWGYYNNNSATNFQGTQYYYPNYDNGNTNDNVLWSPMYIYPLALTGSGAPTTINGNNRMPVLSKTKAAVLTKINYPTGGSQTFEYELHDFCLDVDLTNRFSGGLRVKSMKISDGTDPAKDILKSYTYVNKDIILSGSQNRSSGQLNFMPVFGKDGVDVFAQTRVRSHHVHSHSFAGSVETNESKVLYNEVREDIQGKGYSIYKFNNLGVFGKNKDLSYQNNWVIEKYKTEPLQLNIIGNWYYSVDNKLYERSNFPYSMEPNTNWFNGSLSEMATYDNANNMVYKKLYSYDLKSAQKITSYDFAPLLYTLVGSYEYWGTCISKYYYISAWRVLGSETEYLFDPLYPNNVSKAQVKTTNYEYLSNNHKFLTSKKSIQSNGGTTIIQNYKYVADYVIANPNALIFDTPGLAILNMQKTNQLGALIEQTTLQEKNTDDNTVTSVLQGKLYTYKDIANTTISGVNTPVVRPFQEYSLETDVPIPAASFNNSSINLNGSNAGFSFNSNYKRKISNLLFDAKGNAVQSKMENGPYKSTIFGYQNNLPIAEIYNGTFNECAFTSFESDDVDAWGSAISSINPNNIVDYDKHAGDFCYQLPVATTQYPTSYSLIRDFGATNLQQKGKYIISCWVKTSNTYVNNTAFLTAYSTDGISYGTNFPNPVGNAAAYRSTPITNTNGQWRYFSVIIDFNQIRSIGSLAPPPSGPYLAFRTFINNTSTSEIILVDDFKVQPYEANMITSTYKTNIGVTSITDNRNELRLFEFDTYLRPKLERDLNGNIIQLNKYDYKGNCNGCPILSSGGSNGSSN